MELSPEESIRVQNKIGADIIMALDDVVKTTTDLSRMSEANDRTLRWIN
jgi:tRNA-guanine family transglycosylase